MNLNDTLRRYGITPPLEEEDVIRLIDFSDECERYELAGLLLANHSYIASAIDLALSVYIEVDMNCENQDLKAVVNRWIAKRAKSNKANTLFESISAKNTCCVVDSSKSRGWFVEHINETEFAVYPFDIIKGMSKKQVIQKSNLLKQNIGGIIPLDAKVVSQRQALSIAQRFKAKGTELVK
ncbi:hypothetical protein [Vibrio harveyi]|uniref:hypothetical protein n=1 Tax=Vibrio harveyi TaxID=669 RepID=UPI003CF9C38D